MRVFQGIASGFLGRSAFQGGIAAVLLGVAVHFTVSFGAANTYYASARRFPLLVRRALLCGIAFGVPVHLFMTFVVIPLSKIGMRPFVVFIISHLPACEHVRHWTLDLAHYQAFCAVFIEPHPFQRCGERELIMPGKPLLGVLVASALCVQAQEIEKSAEIFASRCAGCHGTDGAGGEHAPSIVDLGRRGPVAQSRQALIDIIRNGLKEGSMPAFTFSDPEMNAVVSYVEALRAPAADHATRGDAAAGQTLFFGGGNCSGCHMLSGHGGGLGPDLTNIARERRLGQIEQALRRPETLTGFGFRPITVRLRDGKTLSGIVKNESNYDLQLQSTDGSLHLFSKSQIESLTREPGSRMPAVKATEREMRDLLAFLTRLRADNPIHVPDTIRTESAAGTSFDQIAHPKPGDWPTYHGRIGGNRHIELTQINTANVAHLAPAWMFPVTNAKRLQVTPPCSGRHHVRHERERVLRGGCPQWPADLALRPSAYEGRSRRRWIRNQSRSRSAR